MNYKVGEELEVIVTRLIDYGVFVETEDGMSGLIHVSEINHSYIQSVYDHFRISDLVKCRIKKILPDGRLELSTVGYPLKNYQDNEDLGLEEKTKEKLETFKHQISATRETTPVEVISVSPELVQVYDHVEKILGEELSMRARETLAKTINKYGIFKFTLELAKKQHYYFDKGLAFNDLLEKCLSHEIKINQYKVSEHAVDQWCSDRFRGENERDKAVEDILLLVSTGVLFAEREDHIYIRNGEFIIPCSKGKNNIYTVKTVLTPELFCNQLIN